MLQISRAQDIDVLAVTQKTADKYKLKTIADLQPVASQLVLGGPAEWKTRHEGLSGLRDVYGLNFKSFKVLDVGGPLTLSAMKITSPKSPICFQPRQQSKRSPCRTGRHKTSVRGTKHCANRRQ